MGFSDLMVCFFLIFFLFAGVLAFFTKKPFIYCLGNMFMVAAVIIIVWSFAIDDGSRRGMDALVLAILWGIAAGSFLVGFILRRIGRKYISAENAVKTEEPEQTLANASEYGPD